MRFPSPRNILKAYPVYVAAGLLVLAIGLVGWLTAPPPAKPQPPPMKPHHAAAPHRAPPKKVVVVPKPPPPKGPSVFELESAMTPKQLMARWDPLIAGASKRFKVPEPWIRAVMRMESGGRTMIAEGKPIVSTAGAMGIMQVMPQTYATMKKLYNLGDDPFDPGDNLMAGTATLHLLHLTYGFPMMFAAYNDGAGMLEAHRRAGEPWPVETVNYVAGITAILSGGAPGRAGGATVKLTRPDGTAVMIDAAAVMTVRAALPGEYAPSVQTVVGVQRMRQGVRENLATVRALLRTHGGRV